MSRVTYVGGFGNGHASAERVGNALGSHYENVEAFTFSDFINKPEKILMAMKKADLITHSAGAMTLNDYRSNPNFAYLLNPPLHRRIGSLVGRTVIKTARMFTPGVGMHAASDVPAVLHYTGSSVAELAAHPIANLGNLKNISGFDAINAAVRANKSGLHSQLAWTTHDAYYHPTKSDLVRAFDNHVSVKMFEGEHDEVVLRPQAFLEQVLNQTA